MSAKAATSQTSSAVYQSPIMTATPKYMPPSERRRPSRSAMPPRQKRPSVLPTPTSVNSVTAVA